MDNERLPNAERTCRITRLLWIVQAVRNNPRQSLQALLSRAGISRSQFYKDRRTLQSLGFAFEYKTGKGFHISEDRLTEALDLTLPDRLLLMSALRVLYGSGDGHLVTRAVEIGCKLVNRLDEPFRTQMHAEFGRVVVRPGYGCTPVVLDSLEQAIATQRRVRIVYDADDGVPSRECEIDPLHLVFLHRALYLYARIPNHEPVYRTYCVNRIRTVQYTALRFPATAFNEGFFDELNNAFACQPGATTQKITLRFSGESATRVARTLWHHSQRIVRDGHDAILFTVHVANPEEVEEWARQYSGEVCTEQDG